MAVAIRDLLFIPVKSPVILVVYAILTQQTGSHFNAQRRFVAWQTVKCCPRTAGLAVLK